MKNIFNAAPSSNPPIRLGLALQGGGAHGAFTAGVLCALLESDAVRTGQIQLDVVSGTSAGAINGVILTHALNSMHLPLEERCDLAIKNLNNFWDDVAIGHTFSALARQINATVLAFMRYNVLMSEQGTPQWPNLSKEQMQLITQSIGPNLALTQLGAMVKKRTPNWDHITSEYPVSFYTNAVKKKDPNAPLIRSNLEHVTFKPGTMKREHVIASAALETLGTQYIDGVPHYDGAYLKNPTFDVFDQHDITDLLAVIIQKKPKGQIRAASQEDIVKNWHDEAQNETMTHHIFHHLKHMEKAGKPYDIHTIEIPYETHWDHTTRYNTEPKWLDHLHKLGYENGKKWLENNTLNIPYHTHVTSDVNEIYTPLS